jgi:hypothetical protein
MDLADAHIRTGPAYQVRARRRKSAEPRSMSACGASSSFDGPGGVPAVHPIPDLDVCKTYDFYTKLRALSRLGFFVAGMLYRMKP